MKQTSRAVAPLLAVAAAVSLSSGCDDGAGAATGGSTSTASVGSTSMTTSTVASGSGSSGSGSVSASSSTGGGQASLSFFVSSTGSPTANLGGLAGADKRCQDLAAAVGAGARTWRAYLSVADGGSGQPVHAKDRIGSGPWYNAELVMVAANLTELHARFGDHTVFLDEKGAMVNGQWAGSPSPNEHDILTGSNLDGTVAAGFTCDDWTSETAGQLARVGHSDGLGPGMSQDPMYRPWQSVHDSGGCNNTAPKGGAGRIYCFAAD